MSNPEYKSVNYILSPKERDRFISDCEVLANDLFGPPDPTIRRDERKRRLDSGTYIRLARTAIRFSKEQVGFMIDIELFTGGSPVESNSEEIIQVFDGEYLGFHIDLTNMTVTRDEGLGTLEINHIGEDDLTINEIFEVVTKKGNENYIDEIFDDMFAKDRIEAGDHIELLDMRKTFFGGWSRQ
jgi:hypothetical protein